MDSTPLMMDTFIISLFLILFVLAIFDVRRRRRIDERGQTAVILLWAIAKHLGLDEALLSGDTEREIDTALDQLCDDDDSEG